MIGDNPEQIKADLIWVAWRDFVVWAIGEPEVLLRYERATGNNVIGYVLHNVKTISREDLEKKWLRDFIIWVTENLWGVNDAPPEYFKLVKRQLPK